MKIPGLLLLAVLCAAPVRAQTAATADSGQAAAVHRLSKLPIFVWAAGAGADQITTYAFSSRYHDLIREQNPMLHGLDRHPALLVAAGSAMDAGSVWLSYRLLRGHPKIAQVVYYSAAAYRTYLAGHNIHMMEIAGRRRAQPGSTVAAAMSTP